MSTLEYITLLAYEFCTEFLPFGIAALVFLDYYHNRGRYVTHRRILGVVAFALYLFLVFNVTGAGTYFDLSWHGFEVKPADLLRSIIPFKNEADAAEYVLNLALFIPLGIMLPALWKEFRNTVPVGLAGASLSLVIEVSQILNHRVPDIDDVFLNTVGALCGYLIYKYVFRHSKETPDAGFAWFEPIVYCVVMFLGRFFAFDEMGAALMLLGF